MVRASLLLPLLALAACDKEADGPGSAARNDAAQVTLDAGDGRVRAAVGGNGGALKVDLPGFKGEVKLPPIKLDAANFELNGVGLYPGSTIEGVDIGGDDRAALRLRFASPADPATVRDWFADRLGKAGFTLRSDGPSLVGKDQDGKPFRMDLTPAAGGANGVVAIGG